MSDDIRDKYLRKWGEVPEEPSRPKEEQPAQKYLNKWGSQPKNDGEQIGVPNQQTEPKSERKNLLERSYGRAVAGASDAMSAVAGDIYGEEGDPTERADYSFPRRVVKAGGSAIAPAVGDIGLDALVSTAQTIAPETSERVGQAITTGLTRAAQSPLGQTAIEGYQGLKREHPYAMNLAL